MTAIGRSYDGTKKGRPIDPTTKNGLPFFARPTRRLEEMCNAGAEPA